MLREWWNDLINDYGIARYCEGMKPMHAAWVAWRNMSLQLWLMFVCRVRGHDFADDGFGGPECGCIDIRCQRCGFGYGRHWLY